MKKRTNKPDAIVVTFSAHMLKHYPGGENQIRRILECIDSTRSKCWGQTISNIPTIEVPWCYIVFGGAVQYRMNVVNFERSASKAFNDGGIIREFENKNWVNLTGPTIKAPRLIPFKGFQGFRYSEFLF